MSDVSLVKSVLMGVALIALALRVEPLEPPHRAARVEALISPEQAMALAVNDLTATSAGYQLRHPHHTAVFTSEGLTFTPRRGGPAWRWQLVEVSTAGTAADLAIHTGPVQPVNDQRGVVSYPRGGLVEQYMARAASVEQQFIIPEPLALAGADLIITGRVQSEGAFEAQPAGWRWSTADGAVSLGQARVFDATGAALPVSMAVTADSTRLTVDGAALAWAAYPVTIDPEIGADDFRLSDMGGDKTGDVLSPAIAYNSAANEYLVVWSGEDNIFPLVEGEIEIFGQRLDAVTGNEVGSNDFRISDMGPDGDLTFGAFFPAAAYNSAADEYLVVWQGDDDTVALVEDEGEIFGQRLDATGGAIGANDFRISDMGPDGDAAYDAVSPAVAYNSASNEYLVVWRGSDNTPPLVSQEYEIYGQRLNATGGAVGTNDFRISAMGPDGNADYDALAPAVAYNSATNTYLVVWQGEDDAGLLVQEEYEIYGQRLNTVGGALGTDDFRISDMGPDGDPNFDAFNVALAYNNAANEYLVVWEGHNTVGVADEEYEIYGQRLSATGGQVGTNDFQVSAMGPFANTSFMAHDPAVSYNSAANEYLVVWHGDDNTTPLVNDEDEIFGQRLDATGNRIGTSDFRISDMGPNGDTSFPATNPAMAYNSADDEYLVVWWGNDNTPPLVQGDEEIFGQRLNATGSEIGNNDARLSDMMSDLTFDAAQPAVAYNSAANEYLVVWQGDDNTLLLKDEELEIFGQRVDAASGAEVGVNDFRISDMGPDGDANFDAVAPQVAYNSAANEYLVVWYGDDDTGVLVDGEFEIFGQRLSAAGSQVGTNDFPISDMGEGDANYDGFFPALVYNSLNDEYLVVWHGDAAASAPLVNDEFEIYGQRLNATGAPIGTNDFRISDMGPNGNANYGAFDPAPAYNSAANEYLVVWEGDDNTAPLMEGEFEIFGQRLNAVGAQPGANDFRMSDMGPDGNANYDASSPAVAYNSAANEYLVVWWGDDNAIPLVDNEFEIYGQRLAATGGTEVGGNDFRISAMGPDGSASFQAFLPALSYHSAANAYLVVWFSDDGIDQEEEIYGQLLNATGGRAGAGSRLSHMGPDGSTNFAASNPALAFNSADNEYLVVWQGDDNISPLVDEEFEIFGQRYTVSYGIYLPAIMKNN